MEPQNPPASATIISPKGSLDSNTSKGLEEKLAALIGQGETRLILNLGEVDYISSAGLRTIIKTVKLLQKQEGKLVLCSMKDYIKELFELSGFVSFLPIYPSLEDSIKSFEDPESG